MEIPRQPSIGWAMRSPSCRLTSTPPSAAPRLIREFDARGGLNTRLPARAPRAGVVVARRARLGAARERRRVARAPLARLRDWRNALAPPGSCRTRKVRALTRVATPEPRNALAVGKAGNRRARRAHRRGWRGWTGSQKARETARQHKSRALHVHQDEDGWSSSRGRGTGGGAVLVRALAPAGRRLYQRRARRPATP